VSCQLPSAPTGGFMEEVKRGSIVIKEIPEFTMLGDMVEFKQFKNEILNRIEKLEKVVFKAVKKIE
jgi:hypothetical protein